jgi:hypothetical protein
MCVIKREAIRLYLIKYLFQSGINSACGFGANQFGTSLFYICIMLALISVGCVTIACDKIPYGPFSI